jgi:Sec-independent protein translocase protein TatA
MDILGIGGWELAAIFIIMLVVAGPKRMLQWSYILGKHVARLRQMWSETAAVLQKEFDDAGLDVKVPQQNLKREFKKAVAQPFQPPIKSVKAEFDQLHRDIASSAKGTMLQSDHDLGTWSQTNQPPA